MERNIPKNRTNSSLHGTELSQLYKTREELKPEFIRKKPRPRLKPGLFFVQDEPFWRTAEEEQREIALINMESRHLMNCVRLLYNGIALKYNLPVVGLVNAVSSSSYYSDIIILRTLVLLIDELMKREEMRTDNDLLSLINLIKAIADGQSFNVKATLTNGTVHAQAQTEYDGYDIQTNTYIPKRR